MRYFLKLSYDGTGYRGWQRQPDHPSIQATIESGLEKLFSRPVHCHGCGRTDTGVHARKFFAHVDLEESKDFDVVFRLNKILPADISIHAIIPVHQKANAQYDASSRTYEYHIHTRKDPFLSRYSTLYELTSGQLHLIEQASSMIKSANDFKMLCKQPNLYNNTLCDIHEVSWNVDPSDSRAVLRITANRFLRAMIRLIVARLVEVSRGEISMVEWKEILAGNRPMKYKTAAYPQGLHLVNVEYPFL